MEERERIQQIQGTNKVARMGHQEQGKENKRTRIINFLTKKPVIIGLCVTALKATFSPYIFSWGPY